MNKIRRFFAGLFCRNRRIHIWHPFNPDSGERVFDYPLSREEVRLLALHWAEEHVDTVAFSVLIGSWGTTDLRITRYTADRWNAAAAILGQTEMEAVGREADARVQERIGDEAWAAFKAQDPLWARQVCDEPTDDGEPGG
jgi:hypothetical protein